jgi:ribosomal protein S26
VYLQWVMLCGDVHCIVLSHVQFIKVQNLLKPTVQQQLRHRLAMSNDFFENCVKHYSIARVRSRNEGAQHAGGIWWVNLL